MRDVLENSEPKTWDARAARSSSLEVVVVWLRVANGGRWFVEGTREKRESIAWEVAS